MKKTAGYIFKVLSLTVFLAITFAYCGVRASSADIIIYAEESEFRQGDTFTISIEIDADVLPGDFEAYLVYPSDIIRYVSGPELVSGGDGVLKIEDHVTSSERNTRKYALKFKAAAPGKAVVLLKENPELYEFEDGYLMSVSTNELSLTILPEKEATPVPTRIPKPTEDLAEPTDLPKPDENSDTGLTDTDHSDPGTQNDSRITGNNETDNSVSEITETETADIEKNEDSEKTMITESKKMVLTDSAEALELAASYEKSLSVLTLIIAVLSALCMALLIVVIRLAIKKKTDDLD